MVITDLKQGTRFKYNNRHYIVIVRISTDVIRLEDINSTERTNFNIAELFAAMERGELNFDDTSPVPADKNPLDIPRLPSEAKIVEKANILLPFLKCCTRKNAEDVAKKLKCHPVHVFRLLKLFKQRGVNGLLPRHHKKGGRDKARLLEPTQEIIKSVIDEKYPTLMKFSCAEIHREIQERCLINNIPAPSQGTTYSWINRVRRLYFEKREGKKKFRDSYCPRPGVFLPTHPLEYCLIDHHRVNAEVVDPQFRLSLGRPWLTVALDWYSRLPAGIYISFESPSYQSVAMVLSRAIWVKDDISKKYQMTKKIEAYGIPRKVHVDNGTDLNCDALKKACLNLGIDIQNRPVRTPEYGGVIERFFGTLDKMVISRLPGKTFGNIIEKGEYNSEKEALLTLDEVYHLIYKFIAEIYADHYHSRIKTTPNARWHDGLERSLLQPHIPASLDHLKLFLMIEDGGRKIRKTGIHFENLEYWDEYLANHIDEQAVFRYDPSDLGCIYLYDKSANQYVSIQAKPEFKGLGIYSLYENRRIHEHEIKLGKGNVPNDFIQRRHAYRQTLDEMILKSKRARKISYVIASKQQGSPSILIPHNNDAIPASKRFKATTVRSDDPPIYDSEVTNGVNFIEEAI